jgi:site-specific DNA-methyltransferase (adenine-specific)
MMRLINADCLEAMRDIPDGSVDMVLTDPPYGTTACKWDSVIPFEPMWEQLKRITKPNSAIVLTASQPFTSALIMSNVKMFKYCWVWDKTMASNFALSRKQPHKKHEDVCIFYIKQPIYNPQMIFGEAYNDSRSNGARGASVGVSGGVLRKPIENTGTRFPSSVQKFSNGNNGNIHPTQKPVALMEYLIRTYTNEGQTVLDFTMGSGTTGVACKNLDRSFIGIEMDGDYFAAASKRIADTPLPIGDLLDA